MKDRPKHFVEKINRAYDLVKEMKEGYVWRGSGDYNFAYSEGMQLNTKTIIEKASFERDITVLDIGTSNGVFISANDTEINKSLKYKHKVTAYGISATDERSLVDNNIPDEKYLTGNAEYLGDPDYKEFRTIASQQFDYIFSNKTFIHLVDPVGAIIQAYNKLKPGGVLVIDEFTLKGCEGRLQDIVTHLRKEGHCIAVSLNNQTGTIGQFCIKKTSKSLEFPLEYDESRIGYLLSPQLVKDNRSDLEKITSAGTLLGSILVQSGLSSYKEFHSLEALLKSKNYLDLPYAHQVHCILYVVAKELSAHEPQHQTHQLSSMSSFFPSSPISLQKILNLKRLCYNMATEGEHILVGDVTAVGLGNLLINSKNIPLATRLNLIRLTACQKMLGMDLENIKENAKAFAQMDLQPSKIDYLYSGLFGTISKILSQPKPPQPINVVIGRKFTENSQSSELSPYFKETLKFISQNKDYICNLLQIKLVSSYNFTKVECIGTEGHYSFKLLAESNYSGEMPQEFIIPASQFLAIMNRAYSTAHPLELESERLPLIFDSPTLVGYLNNNLGATGITVLDSLEEGCKLEEISDTEDPDCFKVHVKIESSQDFTEIIISKKEMSELILQQQSAALERGHF